MDLNDYFRQPKRPTSAPTYGSSIRNKCHSFNSVDDVDKPSHARAIGRLISLNKDGTQEIDLRKPPHGPYGFYIAKGNAKYNHGEITAVCLVIDNFLI